MAEKQFKQVCQCENCGNEAEMVVTCSLSPEASDSKPNVAHDHGADDGKQTKGHAVCSQCGNESEIWVDMA